MTQRSHRPLSRERRLTALTLAAVAGVIAYLVVERAAFAFAHREPGGSFAALPVMLWAIAIVAGSFIAVPLCLAIGMPLWHVAERLGWRSRGKAVQLGMGVGTFLGLVFWSLSGSRITNIGVTDLLQIAEFSIAGVVGGLVAHVVAFGWGRSGVENFDSDPSPRMRSPLVDPSRRAEGDPIATHGCHAPASPDETP